MKPSKIRGNIREIFASIQGEGLFVGTMQLFIRLGKAADGVLEDSFPCKTLPGSRNLRSKNSIAPESLFELLVATYPLDQFFSVSFIGTDSLQQADFLAELLPMFKKAGIKVFAETTGSPMAEFARLAPLVSHWCIDLKCRSGQIGRIPRTLEKIVELTSSENSYFRLSLNADDDPQKLLNQLQGLKLDVYTLIIQPIAIFPAHISDWDTGTIIEWIKLFRPYFAQVRWIPQVHKLLRIL